MPVLELNEVVAWAQIVGGLAYAAMERVGLPTAAMTATLAALATKTVLLD